MKSEMERRILPVGSSELRLAEADGGYEVIGQAAVFSQRSEDLGGFFEEIEPGFFSKVLDGDTRFLLNHDDNFVLGRTPKTLTLTETSSALEIGSVVSSTARNRDWVIDPLERGDISQMSFQFRVRRNGDRWKKLPGGMMLRTLLPGGCAELKDVAIVTFPAYVQTSVGAAKRSLSRWQNEKRSKRKSVLIRARSARLSVNA